MPDTTAAVGQARPAAWPAGPAAERSATSWPAVGAATLCGVAVSMNIGKLPIALPLLRDELGLSLVAAGWLVATFNTIAMLTGVFIGIVSDRSGALRFCMAGMAMSVAGGLIALASQSQTAMLISRMIEGVGFIAVASSAPALVSAASTPRHRRLTLTVWSSYMPMGACLCVLVAPASLAHGGWRTLWLLVLGVSIATAAALRANRRAYAAATAGSADVVADVRQALQHAAPWWLALALACYALQFFAVVTWLPTYLRDERGYAAATIAVLTAAVLAINIPGNLLGGLLLHRGMNRGLLVAAASAMCLLCSLGIYSEAIDDRVRYLLCAILNLVGGAVPAAVISSSAVLAQRPQQVGTLQGLYMQASNIGQFIGALAVATAVAASGGAWSAALVVIVPAGLIAIAAGLAVMRMQR